MNWITNVTLWHYTIYSLVLFIYISHTLLLCLVSIRSDQKVVFPALKQALTLISQDLWPFAVCAACYLDIIILSGCQCLLCGQVCVSSVGGKRHRLCVVVFFSGAADLLQLYLSKQRSTFLPLLGWIAACTLAPMWERLHSPAHCSSLFTGTWRKSRSVRAVVCN